MGHLFTWGLQGILVVQVCKSQNFPTCAIKFTVSSDNYYISFPRDRWYWKFLIYFLLFVEFVQTILATNDAYTVYAAGFGNVLALDNLHLIWLTLPVLSGLGQWSNTIPQIHLVWPRHIIVGFLCHSIFAYRIYILSELWQVGMFIFLVSDTRSLVSENNKPCFAKLAALAVASSLAFAAKLLQAGTLSKVVNADDIYLFCGVGFLIPMTLSLRLTVLIT